VLTSKLLDAHRDVLKEKEGTMAELLRKVEEINAEGKRTLRSLSSKRIWTTRLQFSKVGSWSWSGFRESRGRG